MSTQREDDQDDDLIGKIKEKAGWLTADREVEADGKMRRLRAIIDGDPDASEEDAERAAEAAERDVREGYGEYDPGVDDEPTAIDDRPVDHPD